MLPILPVHTKKKKKSVHRPRPQAKRRCVPPASTATINNSAKLPENSATTDEFEAAFSADNTSHPSVQPNLPQDDVTIETQNDQEALVLAAEAAAALLDVDVGDSINAAALLEVEDNEPNPRKLNVTDASDDDGNSKQPALIVPALPPIGYSDGPLGPNVKTFTSDPPKAPMSCVHSNFLQYYYGNEAVGSHHALDLKRVEKKDDDNSVDDEKDNEDGDGNALNINMESKPLMSFCSKYPKRKAVKEEDDTLIENETNGEQSTLAGATDAPTLATNTIDEAGENDDTVPEVQIINGEIVINSSSLFPDSSKRVSTNAIDEEFGTAVVEDSTNQLGIVQAKYDSYTTKRTKPNRWGVDETREFYRALRQCGPDFSMMQMFLPGRTRGQLKNKFKTEQRQHPRLVDMALDPKARVKLDLSIFGELEIPEEVTPITLVQPTKGETTEQPAVRDVTITETCAVEREETAIEAEADMDRMFDHLFDDENNIESTQAVVDENNAAPESNTTNHPSSQKHTETTSAKQPALLLAPASKPKSVRKTKKFKAKPMVKKAAAAKKV